ncbi:hypothetical protein MNV49_003659 [Pseudohyphozyma bogoriensis]|nr:hypothetical protein MNV49_003659 [Pseudohyphozyma bogoriensis]
MVHLSTAVGTLVNSTDATDFGSCTTPEIKGAVGLDNRVEFAFEPVDLTWYPHTSAQGIQIITQFICDTPVNTCGASTAAHDLCTGTEAAVGSGKNDGGLADKFNAAFGITTDFANAEGSSTATDSSAAADLASTTTSAAASATTTSAASATSAAATAAVNANGVTVTVTAPCPGATSSATSASSAAASTASAASAATSTSNLDFGSCGSPKILFENGLDGRNTPAFVASDQTSFNHGSTLGIDVITSFIVGQLQTSCKALAEAISTAQSAASAANAAGATTGAAADAWNAAFGITTTFANGATDA